MRFNTSVVRNLAFIVMLAALPLAQTRVGADGENCGPDWCVDACSQSGGYLLFQGCEYCEGTACDGGGPGCTRICESCGGSDWICSPY
jgi:hypothetical protein